MDYTIPLIQTKFQGLVQSIDPVPRPRLTDWLEQRWERTTGPGFCADRV